MPRAGRLQGSWRPGVASVVIRVALTVAVACAGLFLWALLGPLPADPLASASGGPNGRTVHVDRKGAGAALRRLAPSFPSLVVKRPWIAQSRYNTYQEMHAIVTASPSSTKQTDLPGLEALALGQGGYFDRGDAQSHGITDSLLGYHTRTGRFERILPGVYRLHVAPISPYDEYLLAWVWTNYRGAISHESALALYDLADILPARVHVTVPRPFHRTSAPFQAHLASLPEEEVQMYNGVRATTPARAIVDSAATGTDPNQIHKAVREALDRGLVDPDVLRAAAARRSNQYRRDVRWLLEEALSSAATGTR